MPDTAEQVYEFWAPVKFAWVGVVEWTELGWRSPRTIASIGKDDAAALIRDAVARWLHGKGWSVVEASIGFVVVCVDRRRDAKPPHDKPIIASWYDENFTTYDEALRAAAREVGG